MDGKPSEVGERGAPSAASLSKAPFCSGAQTARTPSGAILGKGERAFSLPPPLCSVKDPKILFLQQAWVLAVYFGKAAPAMSPHRGALGGFPKAGKATPRRRGVSVTLLFGLSGVNLDTYGPYTPYTLTFAWLESTLCGSYSLPG